MAKKIKPWSNIESRSDDPEIVIIDEFEKQLENIPASVRQIRELISGFELCHFKYQTHIKHLIDSILKLKPNTVLEKIGASHIRHGEDAWEKDRTGRSLLGQQYVWALNRWPANASGGKKNFPGDGKFADKISGWLGRTFPEKERLVRLLVARLIWDWTSYEKYLNKGNHRELEFQVCRMDICHYQFPGNMNRLIQGIGKMEPVQAFQGCGSADASIKAYAEKECLILNDLLKSISMGIGHDKKRLLKTWLLACFAKTLKDQAGLTLPIHEIPIKPSRFFS